MNEYQKNNNLLIENKKLLTIRIEPNFNYNCNVAYFDNIQVCDDDNGVIYERNEKGRTTEITGNLGNKTTLTRDANSDEILKIKDYKNNESDFAYRASPKNHQMAGSTVPTAGGKVKTTFTHDARGNAINSESQAESGQGQIIETATEYTNSGNYQKFVTDSRGKITTFDYNENNGNLISSTQKGVTTNYAYDAKGRAISAPCNGSQVNYNYSNGVLSSVAYKLSNSANVVYNFARDVFWKITQTKVGNHALTTNSYDSGDGLLNQIKFANNQQVDYVHDGAGRVVKKRYYSGKDKQNGTFEYTYNNKGELVQTFDEKNNLTTKFKYDKFGRIVDLRRSDNILSTMKYDPLENLVQKINSKIFAVNQIVENTFGVSNNFEKSKITTGNNSIWSKYFYNALGQVQSKETINADETTDLKHEISYIDGSDSNKTTNLVGSVNIQKKVSGIWSSLGKTFSYNYNDVGNISVLKENDTPKVWYYYDRNGQLIRENNRYLGDNGQTITYKYDLGGNIGEKKIYSFTQNNDDGDLASLIPETISYGYHNDNWKDQLSSYNGQGIIYDGVDNPIS